MHLCAWKRIINVINGNLKCAIISKYLRSKIIFVNILILPYKISIFAFIKIVLDQTYLEMIPPKSDIHKFLFNNHKKIKVQFFSNKSLILFIPETVAELWIPEVSTNNGWPPGPGPIEGARRCWSIPDILIMAQVVLEIMIDTTKSQIPRIVVVVVFILKWIGQLTYSKTKY